MTQERDTVSAAVHAAGALLYPLRWQHIYLPLLPLALKVCDVLPKLLGEAGALCAYPGRGRTLSAHLGKSSSIVLPHVCKTLFLAHHQYNSCRT